MGGFALCLVAIGYIQNNVLKMSTKWSYPWTYERDFFAYVQNSPKMAEIIEKWDIFGHYQGENTYMSKDQGAVFDGVCFGYFCFVPCRDVNNGKRVSPFAVFNYTK